MKRYFYLSVIIIPLLVSGCQSSELFYWGGYSSSLYALKKNPDDKTLLLHKKSLEDIIRVSINRGKRVPPGVFAELGYILFKEGKENEAIINFDAELRTYPESSVFVNKIKIELQNGSLR